jgi:hypothetical protein
MRGQRWWEVPARMATLVVTPLLRPSRRRTAIPAEMAARLSREYQARLEKFLAARTLPEEHPGPEPPESAPAPAVRWGNRGPP